jgi:hypothetical protein
LNSNIFLIQGDESLSPMREEPYQSEDILQSLLEKHPELLAGDRLGTGDEARWLLVSREMAVPSEDEGGGRWFLDHLFLDPDAIPTLVEVKRSSDTRIRREVVGQMLDYAANATLHWPIETIRSRYEASREKAGQDPAATLREFLRGEDESIIDDFWQKVKTNLQAGRIRLVFVADEIPSELERVIEFLNGQMDPAEVIGVELRQFVGSGVKTLVPRVVGQTAASRYKKSAGSTSGKQWDESSFLAEIESKRGVDAARISREILEWVEPLVTRLWWGKGETHGSCTPYLIKGDKWYGVFAIWTYGTVELHFQYLANWGVFQDPALRNKFREKINRIEGVSVQEDAIARRPGFPIQLLAQPEQLEKFKEAVEWALEKLSAES